MYDCLEQDTKMGDSKSLSDLPIFDKKLFPISTIISIRYYDLKNKSLNLMTIFAL